MRLLFLLTLFLLPLQAADLTVATFNIRYDARGDKDTRDWKNRRDLVVKTIKDINPDVLGIQEGLHHQVKFLAEQLPDYSWIGVGRDDGKTRGEFCAIFYRKSTITLVPDSDHTFWLSDTPDKPGSKTWGNSVTRIATHATFTETSSGKKFAVYNTHWDHRGQASREKSAELLYNHSEQTRARIPTIIMGDFNATPNNKAMKTLLRTDLDDSSPLTLSYFKLHPVTPNLSSSSRWTGNTKGSPIDHVLISPQWKLKRAWIDRTNKDGIYPSDHYPVAAVLSLD